MFHFEEEVLHFSEKSYQLFNDSLSNPFIVYEEKVFVDAFDSFILSYVATCYLDVLAWNWLRKVDLLNLLKSFLMRLSYSEKDM